MDVIFYALGSALILSYVVDLRAIGSERCLSFGLVRILLTLPLLAGAYLYFASNMTHQLIAPLFFLENVFSLIWILAACRLQPGPDPASPITYFYRLLIAIGGILVLGSGSYGLFKPPAVETVAGAWVFPRFGSLYISSLFMLLAAFFMVWRLEMYWRALKPQDRWRFKYLAVGFFVISVSLFWCASYRLSYLRLVDDHFQLLAILLLISWLFVSYAVARHRLLNRTVFVSRKVVYSGLAPAIFAGYLILLGGASVTMRAFGWSLPFVLQWLMVILGLLLITVLALSGTVRKSVKYFISTHFYVNKYEYRDEWLSFSNLLRGTLTERGVEEALHRILKECLYTDTIKIWLGNENFGFRLSDGDKGRGTSADSVIAADDPLVLYLKVEPYLYIEMPENTIAWQRAISEKKDFFLRSGLVMALPLTIGGQCVGLIGLGPEYTESRYGRDDFDLLTALCSQAASAILAARTAERLAQERESSAWNTLSAFVLHDIKNAATMLNLVKENAPVHIHKPEFQQDMLVSIDDALKRMNRVQARLKTLKGEATPVIEVVEIGRLVRECCNKLARKLPDLIIDVQCRQNLIVQTDSELMAQILENLMLNALEAGGPGTKVHIEVSHTDSDHKTVQLDIGDNGPGIPAEMLPDRLFDPFKTTKPNGTGIGLWQVRRLVESLGGSIVAENVEGSGAKFLMRLPINGIAPEEA